MTQGSGQGQGRQVKGDRLEARRPGSWDAKGIRRKAQGKNKVDRINGIDWILLLQRFPDESTGGNPLARR